MSIANNTELPLVLSASGTTLGSAVSSAIQSNPYGRGIKLQISAPVVGAGSFTVTIQGVIAGVAYTILVSAAISGTGTTILTVYPGATAAANVVANDVLPARWQVTLTPTGFTGVANINACVIV